MTNLISETEKIKDTNYNRLTYFDSVFYSFKNPSSLDLIIFYDFKGAFYARRKEYIKGLNYADSVLKITAEKVDNPKFAIWHKASLFSKGDMYLALKKYEKSIFYYTSARNISNIPDEDRCKFSGYLGRIAGILYAQKKYQLAATYYFNASINDTICQNMII